jgi:hypothetical protein
MQVRGKLGRMLVLTTTLVATCAWIQPADAAAPRTKPAAASAPALHQTGSKLLISPTMMRYKAGVHPTSGSMMFSANPSGAARGKLLKGGKVRYADPGLQCVPFARSATGIEIQGNATNWWDSADGVYERGSRPEPGSVLNFRSIGRMRLGHVAAVTTVVNSREIEIDHANWGGPGNPKGRIARGISVVDVSDANDWSAVRVELGRTGEYGSVYPTYGFIYDRPDHGVMVANNLPGHGAPSRVTAYDEVAEAPSNAAEAVRAANWIDAPTRSIR